MEVVSEAAGTCSPVILMLHKHVVKKKGGGGGGGGGEGAAVDSAWRCGHDNAGVNGMIEARQRLID